MANVAEITLLINNKNYVRMCKNVLSIFANKFAKLVTHTQTLLKK